MLHIKYKLAPSKLHGTGVFADEGIKQGQCIVEASSLDVNLSFDEFNSLSESEQREVMHHGHFDKVSNMWHVDFHMTRFMNHDSSPNCEQRYNGNDYYIVALHNIYSGQEMTINYEDFEVKRVELK